MHLFYIRNYLSILTAESIIKYKNLNNAIAYIVDNGIENYYTKLKKNMDKHLWKKIKLSPVNEYTKIYYPTLTSTRGSVEWNYKIIEKSLLRNNITEVYLSNIACSPIERIYYKASHKLGITINYYEEGANIYLDLSKVNITKYYMKRFRNYIFPLRFKRILSDIESFKADKIYCCFPEAYPFDNVNSKVKINLNFNLFQKEKDFLLKFDIDTLFLSRPLSECKIITLEDELAILKGFLENNSYKKDIYVKFHPRESKEKIQMFKSLLTFKEIPIEYRDIPAEKLVLCGKVKNLIGYETGTLMYVSEFSDIKVCSLLKKIYSKSNYLNMFYNLYLNFFPRINFKNI